MIAAHAAYFLAFPQDGLIERTGVIAVIALLLLVVAGVFSSFRRCIALAVHTGLSVAFIVALTIYVRGFGFATIFLLGLFGALSALVIVGYAALVTAGRLAKASVARS